MYPSNVNIWPEKEHVKGASCRCLDSIQLKVTRRVYIYNMVSICSITEGNTSGNNVITLFPVPKQGAMCRYKVLHTPVLGVIWP
jgi:hypothetical protein